MDMVPNDIFAALAECSDEVVWVEASREPCFQLHPVSGETVLHLLAKSSKLSVEQKLRVLSHLKRDYRNPLVLNWKNQRPIDLAANQPELKEELAKYMQFQPRGRQLDWFVF